MNCQASQQAIYVYDELLPAERQQLNAHLAVCEDCQALYLRVRQQTDFIQRVARHKPEPADAQRLTQRILAGVERQRSRISWQDRLLVPFQGLFVRYSLVVLSLALVVGFVYEQQGTAVTPRTTAETSAPQTTVLDTRAFAMAYQQKKERGQTTEVSWHQCVRDETCAASLWKTVKNRKLSSL